MVASLGTLTKSEFDEMVYSLLLKHNIGESSEQLIANLRDGITNQQINDSMDSSIDYTVKQCKYILKK